MHELIMQLIAGEAVFKVADELYEVGVSGITYSILQVLF